MNFQDFVKEFNENLKDNNKNCIKLLEKNKNLIEENLSERSNSSTVDSFVKKIEEAILNNKKKFNLFETVLKHDNLSYIYSLFKKSDVLIKACQSANIGASKWLLTMDISPYVQNKEGMTALMYAVQNKDLKFVVDQLSSDIKCCNIEDMYGNNALFYSVNNLTALLQLKNVDINHINRHNESVLLYCCKNEIYDPVKYLINREGIDLTIVDSEGKTALMYLIENDRDNELNFVTVAQMGNAFNFINEQGESVLSLLIKRMYRKDEQVLDKNSLAKRANIFISLVKGGADFNIVVDEDGNTALMAILIARDLDTFNIVASYAKDLDFSKRNLNGENATSLFLKIDGTSIYEKMLLKKHPTFDYKYVDPVNNNTALILATINNYSLMEDILKNYPSGINDVNSFKENALILSAKINNRDAVNLLLGRGINVNQQDDVGNTALHYAVTGKNAAIVYDLVKNGHADVDLKNHENESALEIAKYSGDKMVLKALTGAIDSSDLEGLTCIPSTITPQISEYLYTNTSNFYTELEKNDEQKEMKTIYNKYVNEVNTKARQEEELAKMKQYGMVM